MAINESPTSVQERAKSQSRTRGLGRVYQPTYRDKKTGELKTAARWWVQYNHRGKTTREPSHSTNRVVAVSLLKKRLGEIGAGAFFGVDQEKVMFKDLAEGLVTNYRINRRRSLARVRSAIANLRRHFGEMRALDIPNRVEKYKADRIDEGAQPATINRELAALKRMFRLARKQVHVQLDIEMLQENNTRKGFFEYPQFRAVVAYLPAPLKPVAETAYVTGWRVPSELLTRRRQHVDLNAKTLRLEPGETKNGEGRTFPMTDELHRVLSNAIACTEAFQRATGQIVPWLFHRKGKRVKNFYRAWRSACKKAGLSGMILHDFRRTAVRNLERAGVPRTSAMKMVGHKTESVYRRYAITDEAMMRDAAQKLGSLHASDARNASETALPVTK